MREEATIKWQYSGSIVKEGNDCLITRVATIMEVDYNYYIVTCSCIINGWNGLNTYSESSIYTSYEEARNYCEYYLMNY